MSIVHCNHEEWWPTDQASYEADLPAAFQAARKVFCVSRHNLELLERQIGSQLPNATVIWNPYRVSPDPPPAWRGHDGVCNLACVARLEPAAKGQDLVFQVLACSRWRERPIEIHLYGRGACELSLRQLAEQLRLKSIHFHGHVEDVRRVWEDNHVLILPSRDQGLPLALVEAMWCGRPAVVTDVGGNAELCVDEETGFVAPAPTAALLAQAMERAWNRRGDWEQMGLAARARAERIVPKDPVGDFCRQLIRMSLRTLRKRHGAC